MKKRMLSILLCVILLLSLLPTAVFAATASPAQVTVELPITKVVKQSGDQAPGEQTFSFELSGLGRTVEYSQTEFEIQTNGAGTDGQKEYRETVSFSVTAATESDLMAALEDGFYVSEKQENIEGWTLDTNSWFVAPEYQSVMGGLNYTITSFHFYDMSKVENPEYPERYQDAFQNEMTFTNTYEGVEESYFTFEIPFEKIVEEGGTEEAPSQEFSFELFEFGGPDEVADKISVDGDSIQTKGAGTYKGEIEITVPEEELGNLSEGFFIREVPGDAEHWTYDDSVWFVRVERGSYGNLNDPDKLNVIIMPKDAENPTATVMVTFEKMTFTNTYTNDKVEVVVPPTAENYTLHYESNGGTEYSNEVYSPDTVVTVDKSPVREGYTFTGWYSDAALKTKITTVTMDADKTVYAGWNQTPVPEVLNGTDHYAYIVGYEDGCIRPLNNITRAEVATIFYRLLKLEYRIKYETDENNFTDVNKDAWYCTAVSTLAHMGILNGRSTTRFAPDAKITRAEFAAICARCDESVEKGVACFTDLDGHWAKAEVEKAAFLGWIRGYADGSFQPNKNITRAESFTLINRVLQRLPGSTDDLLPNMAKWPDNVDPNAWYYIAVQEATCSHEYTIKDDGHEKWTKLVDNVF